MIRTTTVRRMGMPHNVRISEWKGKMENFWSEKKKEIFFFFVASYALGMVIYREYQHKSECSTQKKNTPQQQSRDRALQLSQLPDGAPRASWARKSE